MEGTLARPPFRITEVTQVVDKNLKVCSSMDDVDGDMKRVIVPSMFPPSREDAEKLNLHRTFRILPHSQDSGGFFVAIIKKTQPFEKEPSLNCQPLRFVCVPSFLPTSYFQKAHKEKAQDVP